MAPRTTRSKPVKGSKTDTTAETGVAVQNTKKLVGVDNEQHRLFLLPEKASTDARIISLPNPASSSQARYLYCPKTGLYEFKKVSSAKTTPQSCLIAKDPSSDATPEYEKSRQSDEALSKGYILEDASLFVGTPMDPVFFILPLFQNADKLMFRMADDYIDVLLESTTHLARMLRQPAFKDLVLHRLAAVSHMQDLGDERVYKPSLDKLAALMLAKAGRMTGSGIWPTSIEESFVRKQLEIPVISTPQANTQLLTPEVSQNGDEAMVPTIATQELPLAAPISTAFPQITELMRLKTAINFLLSSYVPLKLRHVLNGRLAKNDLIDFTPLNQHLAKVREAESELQALRTLSDNISRKRVCLDDDDAAEARALKKRKKDEEDQRKKAESRGIKQLKKVDTSGMQKLSSFFTNGPKAKAK